MATFTDENKTRWKHGLFSEAYHFLGAHPQENGIQFGVWAPNAQSINVVGDFNNWNPERHPMKKTSAMDFWQRTIAEAAPGQHYKYAITDSDGRTILKSDPFAFFAQHQAHHASIIYNFPNFDWQDHAWMQQRSAKQQPDQPLSIYEVHLGSWRHDANGNPLSYQKLAQRLIPYVKEMGFTHIELLPVMEHPYTPSWGYQVTGYYAPTSRYGRPEDFMAFVDTCHQNGIGVIMDWVPGHFPLDEQGLRFFDGSPLFEHADERRRNHPDWGTHNFDFAKPGVSNFLLSNARFWAEKYHIDGFRVDAVASMLYLDYSKSEGQWLPNKFGGKENLDAVAFLQKFNQLLKHKFPGVLTIAEESTDWPGVTTSVKDGGLGFDYKWNMGWMNDTIHYFSQPAKQRPLESHSITFPRTFAFREQYILPFSHDEVVHLKKPLLNKMPGTTDQKFAQLRLLILYLIGWPGKKLLFMGNELAEKQEWSESRSLNWSLLEDRQHKQFCRYVKNLFQFYKTEPLLYGTDHSEESFQWIDLSRKEEGLFSFSRFNNEKDKSLIFVLNCSDKAISAYKNDAIGNHSQTLLFDSSCATGVPLTDYITTPFELQPYHGLILVEAS